MLDTSMYSPSYSFHIRKCNNHLVNVTRKGEHPDFTISKELREAVYENFPYEATVEEKAIFIYYKLCYLLNYDTQYIYDNTFNTIKNYTSKFDKNRYENIKPGDSVVCWDMARLYEKFTNELGDDIEAVTYSYGNNASHWEFGFYTNRLSIAFNPVEPQYVSSNTSSDYLSDMARLKLGIWPSGISPSSEITADNQEFLVDILDTMYTKATGQIALNTLSEIEIQNNNTPQNYSKEEISKMINEKNNCEPSTTNLEMQTKIQAILQTFKQYNLHGNEALVTFMSYDCDLNYFGNNLISSIVWKQLENSRKREFLIRKNDSQNVYEIDFDDLNFNAMNYEQVQSLIEQKQLVYENNEYTIEK